MAADAGPFRFRHYPAGGGALAEIGSHALATAEFLCGPITKVMGDCVTMVGDRPDGKGLRIQSLVETIKASSREGR
jgi:predicted dehydrogenase